MDIISPSIRNQSQISGYLLALTISENQAENDIETDISGVFDPS